jgi:hypothetical protein
VRKEGNVSLTAGATAPVPAREPCAGRVPTAQPRVARRRPARLPERLAAAGALSLLWTLERPIAALIAIGRPLLRGELPGLENRRAAAPDET